MTGSALSGRGWSPVQCSPWHVLQAKGRGLRHLLCGVRHVKLLDVAGSQALGVLRELDAPFKSEAFSNYLGCLGCRLFQMISASIMSIHSDPFSFFFFAMLKIKINHIDSLVAILRKPFWRQDVLRNSKDQPCLAVMYKEHHQFPFASWSTPGAWPKWEKPRYFGQNLRTGRRPGQSLGCVGWDGGELGAWWAHLKWIESTEVTCHLGFTWGWLLIDLRLFWPLLVFCLSVLGLYKRFTGRSSVA